MIEIIPYIILAIEDDGDREFMAWLYIQYQSLLYSEIIRIVQSSTDAEDVLHTVIEKLIDKVGFLRKLDRRGLVNYIITAAKNTAYNYCRDKKKELDFDFEQEVIVDNYDSLEDDIIKRENLFCLDQVWNSLDSKTQYLLSAKYLLNKSGKEIANDLGMSLDNVRMALVRAKRKARQAMEDWKHSTNQAK